VHEQTDYGGAATENGAGGSKDPNYVWVSLLSTCMVLLLLIMYGVDILVILFTLIDIFAMLYLLLNSE